MQLVPHGRLIIVIDKSDLTNDRSEPSRCGHQFKANNGNTKSVLGLILLVNLSRNHVERDRLIA